LSGQIECFPVLYFGFLIVEALGPGRSDL